MYSENYKSLLEKKLNKALANEKISYVYGLEDLILLKSQYYLKLSTNSMQSYKIPLFAEIENFILKFIQNFKIWNSQNNLKKIVRSQICWLQNLLQTYSNQCNRTESLEINSHIYNQIYFDEGAEISTHPMGKGQFNEERDQSMGKGQSFQ